MQKTFIYIVMFFGLALISSPRQLAQISGNQAASATMAATAIPEQKQSNKQSPAERLLTFFESPEGIIEVIVALSTILALFFYARQARAATKEHLNNVHQMIFDRLDADRIRASRHYIYTLAKEVDGVILAQDPDKKLLLEENWFEDDRFTYKKERWLELSSSQVQGVSQAKLKQWTENKEKAETVSRALDQLGYLVREGIVPLNLVARFYTVPTLKCWYALCPYVQKIRHDRDQKGHMWEWENLVNRIVGGASKNKNVWKDASKHDKLMDIIIKIEVQQAAAGYSWDDEWNPPDQSWVNRSLSASFTAPFRSKRRKSAGKWY
jgi:hypothetical protein